MGTKDSKIVDKRRTIKGLVVDAFNSKGEMPSYEELTELVKTHFPDSRWKKSHYAWYKSKIRQGKIFVKKDDTVPKTADTIGSSILIANPRGSDDF
ncbi:MAG: hypothetical protein Q7J27_07450 [Syntrophales bacterium]|nr:hypothetical protein [Syntrophales bacterium]